MTYKHSRTSFLAFLGTLIIISLAWAAGPADIPSDKPIADKSCNVSHYARSQRINTLNSELEELRIYKSELTRWSQKYHDDLSDMNSSYVVSKSFAAISAIAGIVSGAYAIYEIISIGGFVIFGVQLSVKGAIAFTGSTTTLRTIMIPSTVAYLFGKTVVSAEARTLAEIKKEQIEEIGKYSLQNTKLTNFLTSESCSSKDCGYRQTIFRDAIRRLDEWQETEMKKHPDAPWYWEWKMRSYGRQLAEVQIPWVDNKIAVLDAEISYVELVRNILDHDLDACIYQKGIVLE